MSSFSMKRGGKEVGPASVYAKPHDMKGRAGVRMDEPMGTESLHGMRVVVGNIGCCPPPEAKTSGIRVRGTTKQTKGFMARGPMG